LPKSKSIGVITGLSFRTILVTLIGILLFGTYVSILIYGENSLTVLNHLKAQKKMLKRKEKNLKIKNQKLQKELFELKQLEPKE
jgi:cytosine/uracil/thiamine/allantoin permease